MTATVPLSITSAGVYPYLPAEVYHADPVPGGSLSASGAKLLLPPSCPALYRYDRDHPAETRRVFEVGNAAHALVLGTGPELVDVGPDDWRTKEQKALVADVRERGAVPLKTPDYHQLHAMAAALRAHPLAADLLSLPGTVEASIFWQDTIWRRARLDKLPDQPATGRAYIVDYKTCRCAAPDGLDKVIADYGYHCSGAWYIDAARSLGLDPAFVLIFQEKTPPYLVTVAEPNAAALSIGRRLNRWAIDTYAECVETGVWSGYADDVQYIALPPWIEAQYRETR